MAEGTTLNGVAVAMRAGRVAGLLVGRSRCEAAFLEPLRGYEVSWPFVARTLTPRHTLYMPEGPPEISPEAGDLLATVARRVLDGSGRRPRLSSFPDSLRRDGSFELMVLLRDGERARLWRSARGRTRARAFLTAIGYAGSRWRERESAMGGPLRDALPTLTVEIIQLQSHGGLGEYQTAFVNDAVPEGFGLGFERAGRWRYLLPRRVSAEGGGASALSSLLQSNGLNEEALERGDIRVYRFRGIQLGVSEPSGGAGSDQD